MKLAIGGIMHESNSFSSVATDLEAFESASLTYGDDVLREWAAAHHEMGGFIEGADRYGYLIQPILMAWAVPAGPVTREAFETLVSEFVRRLRESSPLDGLLLALHGAMVSEEYLDADGEVVTRLKEVMGDDFPIIVTHDFHANISERLVRHSTALVVYKTNPHIDQRERGLQAAQIATRVVRGEVQPVQALAKPPMLLNIRFHNTSLPPLQSIMQTVRALEQENPCVLAASLAGAYQYSDVPQMGPSVVIVTDGDSSLAQQEANRISNLLLDARGQLVLNLPDAAEAVRLAAQETSPPPAILVDMGDNIGGGSAADGTCLLAELIRQKASGWLVVLHDPAAVGECLRAGPRADVEIEVGGKTDLQHGKPILIHGRLRSLHDGLYEETEARHGGLRYHDQGETAVVEVRQADSQDVSYVVLTSKREPPFSLQQLLSLGLNPARLRTIVVKAAVAFRAAYEPIAGRIIEVDTPGVTCVNPGRFQYRNINPTLLK